jgi:hypothetical protein
MTGGEVHMLFKVVLLQGGIDRLCAELCVIERQRKLNLGIFLRAMVSSAGMAGGIYQADVLRSYLEFELSTVARSAFYRCFDKPRERFAEALAHRALAYAQARQVDLPGLLGGMKDWWIVDSTTVKGRDAILGECPGTDFDAPHDNETPVLDGWAIDADVRASDAKNPLHLRLIGVQIPKGYGFFPTNLPLRIRPRQVVDLYRVRWEVESRIKLNTSVNRLDEIDAERRYSLKTLLHVSLIASTITALLAYTYHMKTRLQKVRERWTEAPLHTRPLAAGRILQVQRLGFRPEGSCSHAALRRDCRIPQPDSREAQEEAFVSINSLQPTALRQLNGIATVIQNSGKRFGGF